MSQEPNLSFDDLFGSPTVSPQPELPESAAMENLSIGEPGAIPPPGTSGPAHTGDNE